MPSPEIIEALNNSIAGLTQVVDMMEQATNEGNDQIANQEGDSPKENEQPDEMNKQNGENENDKENVDKQDGSTGSSSAEDRLQDLETRTEENLQDVAKSLKRFDDKFKSTDQVAKSVAQLSSAVAKIANVVQTQSAAQDKFNENMLEAVGLKDQVVKSVDETKQQTQKLTTGQEIAQGIATGFRTLAENGMLGDQAVENGLVAKSRTGKDTVWKKDKDSLVADKDISKTIFEDAKKVITGFRDILGKGADR